MNFKTTKTYNVLKEILKEITIIIIFGFVAMLVPNFVFLNKDISIISIARNILFYMLFLPIILLPFLFILLPPLYFTAIDEFVKTESNILKVLFKVIATNFLPLVTLLILFFLSLFFNSQFGTFAEISYILAIPSCLFLVISIPISIIFFIIAIIRDLTKTTGR